MPYRAILFDLFETLVRFDRNRLPEVQLDGRVVRSTAGHLHGVLKSWAPAVTLEQLYAALLESWQDAERRRDLEHREVPAIDRFRHLFRCLTLEPGACPPAVMHRLLEAHRGALCQAADFPAHHGPLLTDLAQRYRLAVVSNFDYSPTAVGILSDAGVAELFEAIVVSDEIGWRKPAPQIFEAALTRLGLPPGDALFVGDRPEIDVIGAQRLGIDTVWINRGAEPLPAGMKPPTFEIRDLAELRGILIP
jgi:FMN phosphatase YigB (HAD superfamily)